MPTLYRFDLALPIRAGRDDQENAFIAAHSLVIASTFVSRHLAEALSLRVSSIFTDGARQLVVGGVAPLEVCQAAELLRAQLAMLVEPTVPAKFMLGDWHAPREESPAWRK